MDAPDKKYNGNFNFKSLTIRDRSLDAQGNGNSNLESRTTSGNHRYHEQRFLVYKLSEHVDTTTHNV